MSPDFPLMVPGAAIATVASGDSGVVETATTRRSMSDGSVPRGNFFLNPQGRIEQ